MNAELNKKTSQYDYVIVGSGSAGAVVSYRLAAAGHKVLVLEAGGSDWGPILQMPSALQVSMSIKRYNWDYSSVPQKNLKNRVLFCPRGKVIGGSSSINGMVYVRGHARDFDSWEVLGAQGWSYQNVLPYFMRMEKSHAGEKGWRGTDGPMHVTRGTLENPLYKAFIDAGVEAGYNRTQDYNGSCGEGFGAMERTVYNGRRWSTASAYLRPALETGNVTLIKHALVNKVIISEKTARGVAYSKGGDSFEVFANKEVILCAGAINTPKLLELSGVGRADVLLRNGIDLVHELPGVGENMQDHPEVIMQWHCKKPITLNKHNNVLSKAFIGAQWLLTKEGLGATNHFEACAFIRDRAGIEYPNLEFHFMPAAIQYDGTAIEQKHGFQIMVASARPLSRGSTHIQSSDPDVSPRIDYNFYDHPDDIVEIRNGIRLAREVIGMPAMNQFAGEELLPGAGYETDEQIDQFILEHTGSAYHPCGTCVMGDPANPMTVVDPECRVVGLMNLRVIDSSIIPLVPMGNINAPSIMIGEKGADHVLGIAPIAPATRQPIFVENWQSKQR
ncbi:choline dehydrogenase [Pseudomonas sp. XWY-1]|uniref:choline dehydrogenase n=1 Tax=Pseudomonas sp. XWY-1 TaxID=2069256 RepID=UPI002115C2E6|nr:choline dehydrogenase [Pseudomonas sp. XWY-1]